ncbi:hypothetical protein ACFL17_07175 [Pseudomonadota bacterium]
MNEKYAANGKDYLRMAFAIAQSSPEASDFTQDDQRMRAIVKLIDGSSFDDRLELSEREDSEQRSELQKRLNQLVDHVTSRVDLDWMRRWSQRTPIGVGGRNGIMSDVSLIPDRPTEHGWGSRFDMQSSFEGNASYNRIAPCIRLGATAPNSESEFSVDYRGLPALASLSMAGSGRRQTRHMCRI